MIVRPYPGLIWIEKFLDEFWLRVDPIWGWGPRWQPIREWKRQVHVIERAALSPALREALGIGVPEKQLSEARPWMRRMFAAARLVFVPEARRRELLELGVRVYTIGYHRVPDLLRIIGVGGGRPTLWIEQTLLSFYGPNPQFTELVAELAWIRGPRSPPNYFESRDLDHIDRILRAATDGAVDHAALDLAIALQNCDDLATTEPSRWEAVLDELRQFADEEWAARDIHELQFPLDDPTEDWESWLECEFADTPEAELVAVSEALKAGELESVDVEASRRYPDGAGTYHREQVPALRLVRLRPKSDRWLDDPEPLWRDAPPVLDEGYLHVPATHRYVRIG